MTDRLRALAAEGFTMGKIARQLGVSRNAVCGKMHRNGIPSRNVGIAVPSPDGPNVRHRRAEKPTVEPPMPEPEIASEPVSILELTTATCRFPLWPHDAQPDMWFCGAPVHDGSVYCRKHYRVCFQVVSARKTA